MAVITFPCPICDELIEMTAKYDDVQKHLNFLANHKGKHWQLLSSCDTSILEEAATINAITTIAIGYAKLAFKRMHEAG